ncbi:MAG: hypothetical protein WC738_05940 [Candidatus Omnitrophota bacterium]|jgi:spermidine synthase
MKEIISLAVVLTGFTAMASQIVFARELLVVFYGNELSIGFILASWLAGGAVGSGLLGRFADRVKSRISLFVFCQIVLGITLPLTIVAIRCIKTAFHVNPGEIISLPFMAISSFIVLVPVCSILGFMFSLACRIYDSRLGPGTRIGTVYVLESIGAVVGGLAASFVMIRFLNSIEIMAVLSVLNTACSFIIPFVAGKMRFRVLALSMANVFLMILIAMWPVKGWTSLEKYSVSREWQGHELVASGNSIYGNVALTKKGAQYSFFDNGLNLYTVPNRQSAEEAVHYALLEHPNPSEVLLIGGGAGGAISEILKHPFIRCDYVELDPLIIDMAKMYLPEEYRRDMKNARVHIYNADGRFFIKNAGKAYDCVIVNVGDPYTAQINRYYTVEFFREVKKVLKKGGILSFGLSSSENYINAELEVFLRSIYTTLREVFGDVLMIPGDTIYFLAASEGSALTYDYTLLMGRARERALDLRYVREYYLSTKLSPEKISYVEGITKGEGEINRDFRPIAYYYDTAFWASRFMASSFKWIGVVIIFILAALSWITIFVKKGRFEKSALMTLAAVGFAGMSAQIIILMAYQVTYGYLYYKLGILLTSYMAGLAVGGIFATRIISKPYYDNSVFLRAQTALILYIFALPFVLGILAAYNGALSAWLGSNFVFPLILIIAGLVCGFQFPVANEIYLGPKGGMIGTASGINYAVDLLGAFLGALATGAFLIPIAGISRTCLIIGSINLAMLASLVIYFKKR